MRLFFLECCKCEKKEEIGWEVKEIERNRDKEIISFWFRDMKSRYLSSDEWIEGRTQYRLDEYLSVF